MNKLSRSKLVCFIATENAAAAKTFYEDSLGLALVEDSPFALVFDAHGTTLRIQKVDELLPPAFTVLGWEVDDVRATINELAHRGVRFERYEGMQQDASLVWTTPDGSRVAWFKDPDGNTLSLTELGQSMHSRKLP